MMNIDLVLFDVNRNQIALSEESFGVFSKVTNQCKNVYYCPTVSDLFVFSMYE